MRIRVYALAIGVGAILLSAAVARAQQPAGVTSRNSTTPQEPKESNSSNLPTAAAYSRPTPKEKWGHFVHEAIGPYTIVKTLAVAGVLDAENSPPDWGQGASGFGDRVGSEYGRFLAETGSKYVIAAAPASGYKVLSLRVHRNRASRRTRHLLDVQRASRR